MRQWRRFFSHWENWCGLLLVLVFLVGAVAAPVISPEDAQQPGPFKRIGRASDLFPRPPSKEVILGTLPGQYDVFHTLVWGMRDAMRFGLLVALGSFLIGVFFGSVSGYAGGFVNSLMMRIADAFLTFPPLAAVVFLQQLVWISITSLGGLYYFDRMFYGSVLSFENPPTPLVAFMSKVDPLMLSLILFSWVPFARLVNSMVLTLKGTDFIQAARALGGNPLWVIRRHLIPNSIGPAVVLGARDVGSAVILQATITFIGLGGASPWGTLLSMGRNYVLGPGGSLLTHWWIFLPVTLAVILFGLSWNLIGDGLNDALRPAPREYLPGRWLWSKWMGRDEQPATVSDLPDSVPVISTGMDPSPALHPQKTPVQPDRDPVLHAAREDVSRGDLSRALHAYQYMIQRGRLLDEIIPDLAVLVKKHPREVRAWQTLGDALARAGDAVHATQSYDQARKLMR
ncbi:MAG TPA: ABC transporter permease subunit [Anaerolineales bacterium]|nr:ABC transporter permease subunit [Anaerolineales bacterium]